MVNVDHTNAHKEETTNRVNKADMVVNREDMVANREDMEVNREDMVANREDMEVNREDMVEDHNKINCTTFFSELSPEFNLNQNLLIVIFFLKHHAL